MKQIKSSTVTNERSRGRPADAGNPDLKALILDAAEQLFTDHGYAGASIRNIADSVGVNPALVYYYFGNKHALLQMILERAIEPMTTALATLRDGKEASVDNIADLLVTMASKQPNIPRLLTREVLLPGGEMQDYFIQNLAPQLGGALPALLQREKDAGKLRADIDPAYSALMILAVCFFPFIARTLAEPVLGVRLDPGGAATLSKQVTDLLERGLAS
jgi:AcrR family transcriptional regulator